MDDAVLTSPSEKNSPLPSDPNYLKIIRSEVVTDPAYLQGEGLPAVIRYFCRDCKKLVSAQRIEGKLCFRCAECGGERVAFGTEASLQNIYKRDRQRKEKE